MDDNHDIGGSAGAHRPRPDLRIVGLASPRMRSCIVVGENMQNLLVIRPMGQKTSSIRPPFLGHVRTERPGAQVVAADLRPLGVDAAALAVDDVLTPVAEGLS